MSPSIARFENAIMNSKSIKWLTSLRSTSAIATAAVVSLVSKDALNCYYYVNQSLHNEKIPDDKRNFVAGLDLANGILNVVFQLALGDLIKKKSDPFFDKYIAPKYYGDGAVAKLAEKMKDKPVAMIKEALETKKGIAKGGMKLIATLVGTTIVCKRVLVPLIATPMATYFRKKFDKTNGKNNPNAPLEQDSVSFKNSTKDNQEVIHPINREKLPKCFQSFTK